MSQFVYLKSFDHFKERWESLETLYLWLRRPDSWLGGSEGRGWAGRWSEEGESRGTGLLSSTGISELSWISYLYFLESFGIMSLLEAIAYQHNAKSWDFNACILKHEDKRSGRDNGRSVRGDMTQDQAEPAGFWLLPILICEEKYWQFAWNFQADSSHSSSNCY